VLLSCVSPVTICFGGLSPSTLHCSSKITDVLRNMSSRLELVMHLLSVVAANVGAGVSVLAVLVVLITID
jgi:hypothetical protein